MGLMERAGRTQRLQNSDGVSLAWLSGKIPIWISKLNESNCNLLYQLHFSRALENPFNQLQPVILTKENIHGMKYYFLLPTNKKKCDLSLVQLNGKLTVYR